jgi:hypothetical protein
MLLAGKPSQTSRIFWSRPDARQMLLLTLRAVRTDDDSAAINAAIAGRPAARA